MEPFLVSMANSGRNTNGSQFFNTFGEATWLNKKHVVFGKVTAGLDAVKAMEAIGTSAGKTKTKVCIVDCGEVKAKAT